MEYFDTLEKYDGQFILNSSIITGSTFENKELVSNLHVSPLSDGEIIEVILGDRKELEFQCSAKVATSSRTPKKGPALNTWSQSLFSFKGIAYVSYDDQEKRIIPKCLSIS